MSSYLSSRAKTDYPLCAPRRDAESLLRWDRGSSGTAPRHKPSEYSTSAAVLPIGEFRQPRSGPLMLLFANSLDGVGGCLVSGLQPPRRDGVVSCLAERSSTRCSALMSAISKIFRWRTGVPARQDSSTRVLPKFPLPTTNHVAADASAAQPSAAPLAVRTLLSA